MREYFNEYKKTLEQVLETIHYLYSGDIISSTINSYIEIKNTPLTSPTFIINSIQDIYNKSITQMFENSNEIIVPKETVEFESNFVDYIITKLSFNPQFLFCSDESKKLFGSIKKYDNTKSLPSYFYNIDRYIGLNLDVYQCPIIEELEGEQTIYAVDNSIQSLVWSLQNMDYIVTPVDETNTSWEHKMIYNFYKCRYTSTKVIIRNLSKSRQLKINNILDED